MSRQVGDTTLRHRVIEQVKKSGMIMPSKVTLPKQFQTKNGNLHVPYDLTDIPTEELGRYMTLFTQLNGYYEVIVSCSYIDYVSAERAKDFTEAQVLLEIANTQKGTLTEKKAIRNTDPRVIEAQDWYDDRKAIYELSNSVLKSCEKLVFMISREITRRGHYQATEGRNVNIYKNMEDNPKLDFDVDNKEDTNEEV